MKLDTANSRYELGARKSPAHAVSACVATHDAGQIPVSALDALSANLAILSANGTILAVNSAWREFAAANATAEAASNVCEGANYLCVCDEAKSAGSEEAANMAAGIRAVLSGSQAEFSLEYPCHSPVERRWFNVRVTRWKMGDAPSAVVAHEDISERKRTEDRLRESEQLYHGLFQNMLNGFAYCEMIFADGHPVDFIFLAVNRAFASLTGLENVVGKRVSDVIPGFRETDLNLIATYGRVAASGHPESIETFVAALQKWFSITVYSPAAGFFVAVFDGITERKQSEDALRRSESKYRELYNATSDAVMLLDESGYIDCNIASLQVFGSPTREDFCSNHPADLSPPTQPCGTNSLTLANMWIREAMEKGSTRFEWVHRRVDTGQPFAAEVLLNAVELDGTRALQAVVRDITERKKDETALRESEAKLRALFDTLPDPVWLKDPDGVYLACNRRFASLFGSPESSIVGRTDYDFVDRELADFFRKHDADAVAAGGSTTNEEELTFADDGHREILETIKTPVHSNDGRLLGVLGVARDITERKRAEAELATSKHDFEEFFNLVPDLVAIVSTDGFLKRANPAWEKALGFTLQELLSKPFETLIHPDDVATTLAVNKGQEEGNAVVKFENRYRHKDGSYRWLEWNATAALGNTKYAVARDVTERKQVEDALRFRNVMLATQQETTLDGILVVDENGQVVSSNQRFVEMWGIPRKLADAGPDAPLLGHVADQVTDQGAFISRVRYLYEHQEETSHDEVATKAGRTISRYSAPMIGPDDRYYGRVWYFRDVTAARLAEEAVQESELRYRTLADSGQALVWTSGVDGACDYFNKPWLEFTGRSLQQECGDGWTESVHNDDLTGCMETYISAFGAREPFAMTYRMRRHDGEYRWILDNGTPRYDSHNGFLGYIGHCLDITERIRAEETMRESEARYRAVTESANDAIITADSAGNIVGWNYGAQRIFGYTEAEISGQPVTVLIPMSSQAPHSIGFGRAVQTGARTATHKTFEKPARRKDGSNFPAELSFSEWEVNGCTYFTSILRDISERKAVEERMAHQVYHDSLTNLPNRVLFQDRLSQALARCARSGRKVAVLFLDVDKFKLINDSLGHAAGDSLLMCVAERIRRVLRISDTAARFAGDEFTVLIDDVEAEDDAVAVADRLLAEFRRPVPLSKREVFVNVSMGIAFSASWQDDPLELMRNADAALYTAKSRGRGRYEIFDIQMNANALNRLELEGELRSAVERKELEVLYQPIISLTTGDVRGVEALVRWNHPTRGVISPLDFIPLAEETGLIISMGRWILHEACRQMQEWKVIHPVVSDMYVAVNLSARQFQQPSLVGEVTAALEECSLPPSCLTLEITESVVMEQTEFTLVTLAALKAAGLRLSIDDFGTGYSSLSYLRRFPVDYLKVDRSFIDGLCKGREDGLIVSSTIGLAHSLGLQVVAEGAESAEQVSLLRDLGCDNVQGYYFHPPLPASEIEPLLASGARHVLPEGITTGTSGSGPALAPDHVLQRSDGCRFTTPASVEPEGQDAV